MTPQSTAAVGVDSSAQLAEMQRYVAEGKQTLNQIKAEKSEVTEMLNATRALHEDTR